MSVKDTYVVIGGGASGIFAALLLKEKFPEKHVVLLEKNPSLGQKLRMTGNGKCNIAPLEDDPNAYNNPEFVSSLFDDVPLNAYLNTFKKFGVPYKTINNYGYYPTSESAPNVVRILWDKLEELDVEIAECNVLDYECFEEGITLWTSKGVAEANKIFIATGGKSYPHSGSDGSMLEILQNHGYEITTLSPSLCPIKVKENVRETFGSRTKTNVKLLCKNQVIFEERGEVMFKKDGLSGIAIMNASSVIAHTPGEYVISLNLLENVSFDEFVKGPSSSDLLLGYVSKDLSRHILRRAGLLQKEVLSDEDKKVVYDLMTNLTYHVDSLYDYDAAQVTSGGVSLNEINDDFSSKKENNVYFLGEVLDIDGRCGGYNLRFTISSSIKCVDCCK